jgi:hypothetical protein
MSEEKIEKATSVRVEKRSGSEATATVKKDGRSGSAEGGTADEALSKAAEKAKG